MAELPTDLVLHDILPRLPPKSVGRFMCVGKVWHSFMKKPEFARLHRSHMVTNNISVNQNLLLMWLHPSSSDYCFPDNCKHIFLTLDYEEKADSMIVCNFPLEDFPLEESQYLFALCSCDGMVLVAVSPPRPYDATCLDLVLWNPLTADYKKFQSMPMYDVRNDIWAFYYDESVDDYRILDVNGDGEAYMYSLKSNSWRTVGGTSGAGEYCYEEVPGVLVDRSIYWMVITEREDVYRYFLLRFDLNDEKFLVLPPPVLDGSDQCYFPTLTKFQDGLHVFIDYDYKKVIELWSMNGNSWTRTNTIVSASDNWKYMYFQPICFTNNGKILIHLLDENVSDEIVIYDPENHIKEHSFYIGSFKREIVVTFTCSETRVSPNNFC